MSEIFTSENLIALCTLTLLEVVLGIDNIVFISILTGRLPADQRARARRVGLALAMVMRVLLLFALSWMVKLTSPLFTVIVVDHAVSGRDLILLGGGLFLIAKATYEIHEKLEGGDHGHDVKKRAVSFNSVLVQIGLLDLVFSLDSVITAVGMASALWVMVLAVMLAVGVMMIFAGAIGDFVERHPTVKLLALSFLILIGVTLVIEGTGKHVDKGYVYFAMAFSLGVEILNLRLRRKSTPVHLHHPFEQGSHDQGPGRKP